MSPQRRPLTLALFILAPSLALAPAARAAVAQPRAAQPAPIDPDSLVNIEPEAGPGQEDPRARWLEQERLREAPLTPDQRWKRIEAAFAERARMGRAAKAPQGAAAHEWLSKIPGTSWVNLGPTHTNTNQNGVSYTSIDSGRARTILVHPQNANILYLGTAGGGVWKSLDAGKSWEAMTDALGSLAVGALALSPSSPDTLMLGFGDPFDVAASGLTVSQDGGGTWSMPLRLVGSVDFGSGATSTASSSVRDLKIDPASARHAFIGTDVGLFETKDGGKTVAAVHLPLGGPTGVAAVWSIANLGGSSWLVSGQLLVDPSQQAAQQSGRDGASKLGLWSSTDNGATWTSVRTALPGGSAELVSRATIAVAQSTLVDAATVRVYLLAANVSPTLATSAQQDVYRSEDSGKSWEALGVNASGRPTNPNSAEQPDLNVMHGQAFYNQAILVDPVNPDLVFIGGNDAMVRSRDGGATWGVMSAGYKADALPLPVVHPDFHAFAVSALPGSTAHTLYIGNDGGIYSSSDITTADDGKATFSFALNEGLATHLIYDIACAWDTWPSTMQGFVMGGLQDNGTRVRQGFTTTFNQVFGGDGIGAAVSRAVTGTSGNEVPAVMLATYPKQVWKSTNGGGTWSSFTQGLPTGSIPSFTHFFPDAAGSAILTYTNPPDSSVYKAVDGDSWQGITVSLAGSTAPGFTTPAGTASAIHSMGTHPTISGVWGVVGDAGTVYVTNDAGKTWTRLATPLGTDSNGQHAVKGTSDVAFPATYDPANPATQTIYASSIAVTYYDAVTPLPPGAPHLFKTSDGGKTWQGLNGTPGHALPDVAVLKVKIDPGDPNTIYVASEIGLYRSTDGGQTFDRFGQGLPLVGVGDLCITGGSTPSIKVGTYGRGFWQINAGASGNPAGVLGRGDVEHDGRLDGFDLIDLAAALYSTQGDQSFREEANLTHQTNTVDDADLAALLARFGGAP